MVAVRVHVDWEECVLVVMKYNDINVVVVN